MSLTHSQRRALEIVQENPGIRPREFAKGMWPDSPGWKRSAKCGPNGAHRGGGMYTAGGAYLGKLEGLGLVCRDLSSRYGGRKITEAGRRALES